MRHPKCPRCWHVIGEHLLCRNHGVVNAWGAGAYRWTPKPIEPCPPEAENDYTHEWWSFLDVVEMPLKSRSGGSMGEIIP